MPSIKIRPAWYVERNGKVNVDEYTPLMATVDMLMDIHETLKYGGDVDDFTKEEMIDNILACLATPGIAEAVNELDENFFEEESDEVPDNIINFPNSAKKDD